MRIVFVGTGYVGLVSGACFAEFGSTVTCVDKDAAKIARLQKGEIPIYEPGLEDMVHRNMKAGRLSFTTDLKKALHGASVVFIAVGTPTDESTGRADLQYVYAAAEEIAQKAEGYIVIVTKSTVPVGTSAEVFRRISQIRKPDTFDVCSNPEFLREGAAISDFMRPDRVVIGAESERALAIMKELYRPLHRIEVPMVVTNLETSELIKCVSNAFLATKITFINQVANLCEKVGANVLEVAKGMGMDGRIGKYFLHAGPGYGGSCFQKDAKALATMARDCDAPQEIVEVVVKANEERMDGMASRIIKACGGDVKGKSIAILGVTFKPNTDDIRDSVALKIIPALQKAGAQVKCYDPIGMENAKKILKDVTWCVDSYAACEGADAASILTEWNEFRALELERVRKLLRKAVIVDLRNIYKPEDMEALGFQYSSIGRPRRVKKI